MSEATWFILGLLCGAAVWGAVFLCLPREKRPTPAKAARAVKGDRKAWAQTRNFLYYDGTEMPVVKENVNEQ